MKQRDNEELGIRCPKCKSQESLVYDSRKKKNFSVMRRRECKNCGFRYTTKETLCGYEFVSEYEQIRYAKRMDWEIQRKEPTPQCQADQSGNRP